MVDIEKPTEVRRLFLDFLILKQLMETPDGTSGYELHKQINTKLTTENEASPLISSYNFSQSQIYRILDDLKSKGFLSVKEDMIINKRLQNLFFVNETGQEQFNYLSKIIKDLFPDEIVLENQIENLLSGKQSPFEILFATIPKDQQLPKLIIFREVLSKELKRVDKEILKLKKENSREFTT